MATYSGNKLVFGVRLLKHAKLCKVTFTRQTHVYSDKTKESVLVPVYNKQGEPIIEETQAQYIMFNGLNYVLEFNGFNSNSGITFETLTFEEFLKHHGIDWVSATHYHYQSTGEQAGKFDIIGKIVSVENNWNNALDVNDIIKMRTAVKNKLNHINIQEEPKLYVVGGKVNNIIYRDE